jgi:hypothetical protein
MKPTHITKPEFPYPVEYYLIDGVFYVKDYHDELQAGMINQLEDPYELVEEIQ